MVVRIFNCLMMSHPSTVKEQISPTEMHETMYVSHASCNLGFTPPYRKLKANVIQSSPEDELARHPAGIPLRPLGGKSQRVI